MLLILPPPLFLLLFRSNPRPKLHHFTVDAICGAVGEVAGLVAFYPLDTIKVKCQAGSIPVKQALQETLSLGPAAALRTLYAGMGSTALGAAAIGSIYLLTFYAAKRAGTSLTRIAAQKSDAANRATSGTSSASREDPSTAAAPFIASAAGAAASIVGSLIDAPIEAFKVRAQAGTGDGPMLMSMARLVATQGLAPLYCSFVPFLLKSIPHDVAELFTYSQLNDALSQNGPKGVLSSMPLEAKDMLVGAASGAAAAIGSMPFDVTFTRMNLGSCPFTQSSNGVGHNLSAFGNTLRTIVVQGGGPQALFAGLVPRLLQCVPAGIVYWTVVEATRRTLESKFEVERPIDEDISASVKIQSSLLSEQQTHEAPSHVAMMPTCPAMPAVPVFKAQLDSQAARLLQPLSLTQMDLSAFGSAA